MVPVSRRAPSEGGKAAPFFPAAHRDSIHGASNGVLQMRHMLAAAAAIAMLLISPLRAEVLDRTKDVDGTSVHYKVVLPNSYEAAEREQRARWRIHRY